jgi:hypothetical protein
VDNLYGPSVDQAEIGAQDFVSPNQLTEASLKSRYVQRSTQAQVQWDVVKRTVRGKLMKKPETLLSEGQW